MFLRNLILLFLTLPVVTLSQKRLTLQLDKKDWDNDRKSFNIHRISPEAQVSHLDTPLLLKDGSTIQQAARFALTIQRESELVKGLIMHVIVAPNEEEQVKMIIDKNRNNNFSDDTVYTISMKKEVVSYTDMFKRTPLIILDSVPIINEKKQREYKTISFKLGICNNNGEVFKNFSLFKDAKTFYLDLYTVQYYSATYNLGKEKYEFAVAMNPLTQNFPGFPGTSESDGAVFFYKVLGTKDSSIGMVPIGLWNSSSPVVKNNIAMGKDTFKVIYLSLPQRKLTLEKFFPSEQQAIAFSTQNIGNKFLDLVSITEYTLVDFSGSWCKPCLAMLPSLKKLKQDLGDKVQFVTVAVENDLLTAQTFHKKMQIPWEMVYENFNCDSSKCLKNIFTVTGFPTILIIDKSRRVIFQQEGSGALEEAEKLLKKLL